MLRPIRDASNLITSLEVTGFLPVEGTTQGVNRIVPTTQIIAQPGDYIGIQYTSSNPIPYDMPHKTNYCPGNVMFKLQTTTTYTVGDTISTTGMPTQQCRVYSVYLNLIETPCRFQLSSIEYCYKTVS